MKASFPVFIHGMGARPGKSSPSWLIVLDSEANTTARTFTTRGKNQVNTKTKQILLHSQHGGTKPRRKKLKVIRCISQKKVLHQRIDQLPIKQTIITSFSIKQTKTKASSVYVYVIIYPLNLKMISKFGIHLWVGTVSTASNKVTKWSKQWPRSFFSSLYFQFNNITLCYKMFLLYGIEVQNISFPQILVKLRSSIKWADNGVSSITLSQMVSLGSRETNKYYHLYPFLCGMI